MPKRYPPLTPEEVISILLQLGFSLITQEGSHRQYKKDSPTRKVTVDMAEKDFDDFLIRSMIRQSGYSRDEFYCATKSTARKINKRIKL